MKNDIYDAIVNFVKNENMRFKHTPLNYFMIYLEINKRRSFLKIM